MKIKTLLLISLLLSFPIFILYFFVYDDFVTYSVKNITSSPVLAALAISCIALFAAHSIRAYKTKILVDIIKTTSIRTHIRALFIGYIFNILLPFRVGELVRAIILGKGTRMSASFMLALVILDRSIDALFLGTAGFISLGLFGGFKNSAVDHIVLMASIALVISGLSGLILFIALKKQPPRLLEIWHRFTALFKTELRDSLRFKLWSAMYGVERVSRTVQIIHYLQLSLIMWVLYIAAFFPLIRVFDENTNLLNSVKSSLVGFFGISSPTGPAHLGSYMHYLNPLVYNDPLNAKGFLVFAWLLQIIPALLVGLIFIFRTKEKLNEPMKAGSENIDDKLLRDVDVSHGLSAFLDAFFTNNSLSRIMHRLEVKHSSKLIKYFKGGSSAITALVYENGQTVVRKITPIQYKYKLQSQYEWLREKANLTKVVDVINEESTDDYYKIDIRYNKEYIPFFDYIHSRPLKTSRAILQDVFRYLFDNIYQFGMPKYRPEDFEAYINDRCLAKIKQAANVNDEIRSLLEYDTIIINGSEYRNINVILEEIRDNENIKRILATYRKCSIHGDTTIDNILVSRISDDFLLIDPTDNENEISGPVFDFGRMTQSLQYGYEFLCRDDSKIYIDNNVIEFEYSPSERYSSLHECLLELEKEYLTPEEQKSVIFHSAVLYSRMLTHRVVINPLNAAKFYAVSVMAFNNFMEGLQYDDQ